MSSVPAVRVVTPWDVTSVVQRWKARRSLTLMAVVAVTWALVRRPRATAAAGSALWARVHFGSWWAAAAVLLVSGCAYLTASVAWHRRGSAGDLHSPPTPLTRTPARAVLDAVRQWHRMKRVGRRWPTACRDVGLVSTRSGGTPRLYRLRLDRRGDVTAIVRPTAVGRTVEYLTEQAPALGQILGCNEITVHPVKPGVATVTLTWQDGLADVLTLADLPATAKGKLPFGLTADARPATVSARTSLLVIGLTGSGKSSLLWSLVAGLQATHTPARLRVIDPAGGVELAQLGRNVAALGEPSSNPLFRVHDYTDNPGEARVVIGRAHKAMTSRLASLRGATRLHNPTVDHPLDIIVVDELLAVLGRLDKESKQQLDDLAFQGRKAGFVVWGLSQLGQVDALGRWRDLIPQRLCLATNSRDLTDAVLGQGAEKAGARCSTIPLDTPGIGYAVLEGKRGYVRFRSVYVTDAETASLARGILPAGVPQPDDDQHVLYRFWGEGGQDGGVLLYVGRTNDPFRRMGEHFAEKDWAGRVEEVTIERFGSFTELCAAEKEAIQTERPEMNIQHAGTRKAVGV